MTLRVGNLGILATLIKHTHHGDGVLRLSFKRAEPCGACLWLRSH